LKLWLFLIGILTLTACLENTISSSGSQSFFAGDMYLGKSTIVRIYKKTNSGLQFVTELIPSGNAQIEIPRNILKTDTEDRTKAFVAVPVDMVMKVYNPGSSADDFYFEVPVLGSPLEPSNVTTAFSWILRWGLGAKVFFSQNDFDQVVRTFEIKCNNCRKKSNSEVVQLILADSQLTTLLVSLVKKSNPAMNITAINYLPPQAEYGYATSMISTDNKAIVEISETQNFSLKLIYIDPLNSTQALTPKSWSRDYNFLNYQTTTEEFSFQSTYTDAGLHLVTPTFETFSADYSLEMTVSNKNRVPLCSSGVSVEWRVNRINQMSLSSICQDLDPEDGLLIYNAVSVPPGLTVSSDGAIRWLPSASHLAQKENWIFKFGVTDPQMGYSEYAIDIHLTPDRLPTIVFESLNVQAIEGVPTIFRLSGNDPDGDPILLRAQAVTPLQYSLPSGSADLSSMVRLGADGIYTWDWTFMPSFLQTVGGQGVMSIKFVATYDPANPNLDSSIVLNEQIVQIDILNTDDPPIWQVNPSDFTAPEGSTTIQTTTAFAVDPNPSATAVTYSLGSTSSDECTWAASNFAVDTVGGFVRLTVSPEYKSDRQCIFTLPAVDSTGLGSASTPFTIDIADTNQPVTTLPTAITEITGNERELLNLQIYDIFSDLDLVDGDLTETYTWQCAYDTVPGHLNDQDCYMIGSQFRPNLGLKSLIGNWLPSATSAGVYYARFTVTDKGGVSATADLQITINQAPSPQDLEIYFNGGLEANLVNINEGITGTLSLRVTPPTGDAVDIYEYSIMPGACSIVGSAGACPVNLLTPNGGFTGTGDMTFDMTLSPSFTDGDSLFPTTNRQYSYTFVVYKADKPSVQSEVTIMVQVNNTNRAPTKISASGCTNCTLIDNDGSPISITLNAASDFKVGSIWQKTYGSTFAVQDPDTNDSLTLEFGPTSAQLGTINGYAWSFKLPACVNPSFSGTVVRTLTFKGLDGRGGEVERQVNLTIQKASAGTSCLQ